MHQPLTFISESLALQLTQAMYVAGDQFITPRYMVRLKLLNFWFDEEQMLTVVRLVESRQFYFAAVVLQLAMIRWG